MLAEKPNITDDTFSLDPTVLDELITHLSTLAAIYHKPPSTFITGHSRIAPTLATREDDDDDGADDRITSDMMVAGSEGAQGAAPAPPPPAIIDLLGGLMDDEPGPAPATHIGSVAGGGGDGFFVTGPSEPPEAASLGAKIVLPSDRGEGMQVRSQFVSQAGRVFQQLTIENMSSTPLSGFAIQYNKNSFGLTPESPAALGQVLPQSIPAGGNATGLMPLSGGGATVDSKGVVQMAIKNNMKVRLGTGRAYHESPRFENHAATPFFQPWVARRTPCPFHPAVRHHRVWICLRT